MINTDMIKKVIDEHYNSSREELESKILEAIKYEESKNYGTNPKTIWDLDVRDGEEYYRLYWDGEIEQGVFNTSYDENAREADNAFLTREEAELEAEKRKIRAIMRKFSRPFDKDEDNYQLKYNHQGNAIFVNYCDKTDSGTFYFESREKVGKAINEIGEERLRKYWFGVE